MSNKSVYFIQPTVKSNDGQYIPCIAKEGETGYYKTDWKWGKDIDVAEKLAEEKNTAMGISPEESMRIVIGTMRT